MERLAGLVGDATVEHVCLTHAHADHAGLAQVASNAFGARLAASEETLARLDLDGRVLQGGDRLEVDESSSQLHVVETPGHSADSLSFYLRPAQWLFAGDTVLGAGSSLVVHPDGRMSSYLVSLAKLIALRPKRILPGHGEPISEAERVLEEYRRHRLDREGQILAAIDAGAMSIGAIRLQVYETLPPGLEPAAEASIRAHLVHLAERGRLDEEIVASLSA
jgi:glyoxylase-like metal-dependent hydrolase (beta-lactamase superfamily II)